MAKKKVRDQPLSQRQSWVSVDDELSVVAQCQLAGIARSTVYVGKVEEVDAFELLLLRLLDEEYTRHPFYGSRLWWYGLVIKGIPSIESVCSV